MPRYCHLLLFDLGLFFLKDQHCSKFIGPDFVEADPDAQLHCGAKIERAPKQETCF